MQISSPAFRNGETIPHQYSRYGEDRSPALEIDGVPPEAQSLALIVDDPDAPRGTFTHWIVFDIDPAAPSFPEENVPRNAREGKNGWSDAHYGGPKPPSGEHRYFFRVFALDRKLNLPRGTSRNEVEQAMKGHVIATAELMGRYAKQEAVPAAD